MGKRIWYDTVALESTVNCSSPNGAVGGTLRRSDVAANAFRTTHRLLLSSDLCGCGTSDHNILQVAKAEIRLFTIDKTLDILELSALCLCMLLFTPVVPSPDWCVLRSVHA